MIPGTGNLHAICIGIAPRRLTRSTPIFTMHSGVIMVDQLDLHRMNILIADADCAGRKILHRMLEDAGFKSILFTADGEEAYELAKQRQPDLLIVDIGLASLDGITLASRLFDELVAPVVLLTVSPDKDLARRAADAGIVSILARSPRPEALIPALILALNHWQQVVDTTEKTRNLQRSLADRDLIDQAKRLLQRVRCMRERDAYKWLRRRSMDTRRSMVSVAQSVVLALSTVGEATTSKHSHNDDGDNQV